MVKYRVTFEVMAGIREIRVFEFESKHFSESYFERIMHEFANQMGADYVHKELAE